jgi:hypothetical protein
MYVDEEEKGKQKEERKKKRRRTKMYNYLRYTDHNRYIKSLCNSGNIEDRHRLQQASFKFTGKL